MTDDAVAGLRTLLADDPHLADVDAADLVAVVLRAAGAVAMPPGASVFVVGCGTGALGAVFTLAGAQASGVDDDAAAVAVAREALPDGTWDVGDPASVDPGEPADYVVAAALFARYRDQDVRRGLVARMAAKATRGVLLFDVGTDPDVPDAWFLRAAAQVGAGGVQFQHDDDPRSGRTRTHVLMAAGS